ncbi:hypothetical protein DH2020_016273 [Rehmannia glutinosa]|uniref:Two-component response regulator-like protein n=1 Tax=Rehmannia glutinosa TaxID=99300 RepID=A0ABR0WMH4_REHGL
MWELGNLWTEAGKSSSMASSYLSVMPEIHVLLVDHDSDSLINTAKLLESCQYRVTLAEFASGAIQILSNGKAKIDIIMANINSPDLHGFKLLQQAANMNIPTILMSVDDNTFMAMRALENGAFLYIKKPAAREMLKCLWQHVAREKTRVVRERERLMAVNYSVRGIEIRETIQHADENANNIVGGNNVVMMKDKGKSIKNVNRGRKGVREEDYYESENHTFNSKIKRKVCTEWTQELHEKFMAAVEELGEGRCFPKEILELMDVPGLTRMQVASHLQKCRNDNWRSPEDRKSNLTTQTVSSDTDGSHHRPRRFGSMPRLGKAPNSHRVHVQEETGGGGGDGGEGSKTQSETKAPNDGGVENMETTRPTATNNNNNNNNNTSYQQYGPIVPHPGNGGTYPTNPRHPTDDFFNFPDMDSLMQNYPGLPQASTGMNIASSSTGGYHFDPVYNDQQIWGFVFLLLFAETLMLL